MLCVTLVDTNKLKAMKTIKINDNWIMPGYELSDLSEEAYNKAIDDHINFWLECREYDEEDKGDFERSIDKAESMHTPWFTGSYIFDYCMEEIIEELEINEYLFDEDGDIIPIQYHVGKDNKVWKMVYKGKHNCEII